METGLVFALLTAVSFGASNVFTRRGVYYAGESFTAALISIFIGILFFSLLLPFTVEQNKIWTISWQGFVLLGAGGIIHFVAGRLLNFNCIRLIGANRAGVLARTATFYAVIFAVLILGEPLTIFIAIGALCIGIGTVLVSIGKEGQLSKMQSKAILLGLAAAFCWGISGVFLRPGIEEMGSPVAAAFISYLAASLIIAGFLFQKSYREQLFQLNRSSLTPLIISGVFLSLGQLTRFIALNYSPVSLVEPLSGTMICFTILFSFMINRKIEVFTWKVIVGMVATVLGAFLLFL